MPAPWLPVPHHKQRHRADCLAACAARGLDYLGLTVSYPSLLQILDIAPDLGAPASNIRRLSTLGISVTYGSGTLHELTEHLAQRRPCIAFVHTTHLSYWSEATRHAVVVVGMNREQVYLNDPFFDAAPQVVARLEFALQSGVGVYRAVGSHDGVERVIDGCGAGSAERGGAGAGAG